MSSNFAEGFSSGAAVAPLAAPIVAVPMVLVASEAQTVASLLIIAILSCGIAYAAMYLLVIPIFLITRKHVTWTAIRTVILATTISLGPLLAVELYDYVHGIALGRNLSFYYQLSRVKWDVVMLFFGCGVAVSLLFCAIQASGQKLDAD